MNPQLPESNSKAKPAAFVLGVLFVVSLIFGGWAYAGKQDYKKNADQKIAQAVAVAKKQQASDDHAKFDDTLKQPYKSFSGSAVYGTVSFSYPKTWSAYIDQTSSSEPINGYFYPGEVPGIQSDSSFPLRVELSGTDYSQLVQQFSGSISDGSVRSTAYIPPKMKNIANVQPGVKLDGTIGRTGGGDPQQGSMVIIKVRDKTLQIYTETNTSLSDFDNIVLPSLTFAP